MSAERDKERLANLRKEFFNNYLENLKLKEDVLRNLPLYLGHTVKLYLRERKADDDIMVVKGMFQYYYRYCKLIKISGDEIIVANADNTESTFDFIKDVADIFYCGRVTDYHTLDNTAELDGIFSFKVNDDETDSLYTKLRYKEFDCMVYGHLKINELTHKIYACDIVLQDATHCFNESLVDNYFLYKIDGKWKRGVLQKETSESSESVGNYRLMTKTEVSGALENLDLRKVEDITRLPKTNDMIDVCVNGEQKNGLVSAVSDDGFVLIPEQQRDENQNVMEYAFINFAEIENIRFFGVVTYVDKNKIRATIDKTYNFKKAYLENEEEIIKEKRKASYVVGVTESGLIAKNVQLEQIEMESRYGLIVGSTNDFTYNGNEKKSVFFIGDRFLYTQEHKGKVYVQKDDVTGKISIGDRVVNIIKYEIEKDEDEDASMRTSINGEIIGFKETNRDVIEIKINEEGKLEEYRIIDRLYEENYWKWYENKIVYVYRKENKPVLTGTLTREESRVYLKTKSGEIYRFLFSDKENLNSANEEAEYQKEEMQMIQLSEIEKICICGKITTVDNYFGASKNGEIDGGLFFRQTDSPAIKNILDEAIIYELGISKKGFFAYNASPMPDEQKGKKQETYYIIGYSAADDKYVIVEEADYTNADRVSFRKLSSKQYVRLDALSKKDYKVKLEIGSQVIESMEILDLVEKKYKIGQYGVGKVSKYIKKSGSDLHFGFVLPWIGESWDKKGLYFTEIDLQGTDITFNTLENEYLVLYEKKGDRGIPVTILHKNQLTEGIYLSDENTISLGNVNKVKALTFVKGETISYQANVDGVAVFVAGTFSRLNGSKKIIFVEGEEREIPDLCTIYRYGVLAFSQNKYFILTSNDKLEVTALMSEELKALVENEANTKMLIQYTVDNDNLISDVNVIDEKIFEQLEWKNITTTGVLPNISAPKEIVCRLSDDPRDTTSLYLTKTSSEVIHDIKEMVIENRTISVDAKGIFIPTWKRNKPDEVKMHLVDLSLPGAKHQIVENKRLTEIEEQMENADAEEKILLYNEYCYHLYEVMEKADDVIPVLERLFAMDVFMTNKNDYTGIAEYFQHLEETLQVNRFLKHVVYIPNEKTDDFIKWIKDNDLAEKLNEVICEESLGLSKISIDYSLETNIANVKKEYAKAIEEILDPNGMGIYEALNGHKDGGSDFWYTLADEQKRIKEYLNFVEQFRNNISKIDILNNVRNMVNAWNSSVRSNPSVIAKKVILGGNTEISLSERITKQIDKLESERYEPKLYAGIYSDALLYESNEVYQEHLPIYIRNGKTSGYDLKDAILTKVVVKCADETIYEEIDLAETLQQNQVNKDNRYVLTVDTLRQHVKTVYGDFNEERKILLKVYADYSYTDKQAETKYNNIQIGCFELCIKRKPWAEQEKNVEKFVPYTDTGDMRENSRMFYGRIKEITACREKLVNGGETKTGEFVYIYGQKRCGKSSMLSQIFSEKEKKIALGNGEYQQDSLVIKFSHSNDIYSEEKDPLYVEHFTYNLCCKIADFLRSEAKNEEEFSKGLREYVEAADSEEERKRRERVISFKPRNKFISSDVSGESEIHNAVSDDLLDFINMIEEQNEVEENNDTEVIFEKGMESMAQGYEKGEEYEHLEVYKEIFDSLDKKKRKIVVVIDEFTTFCTNVLKTSNIHQIDVSQALDFLRILREREKLQISFVVAGHERMVELIREIQRLQEENQTLVNQTIGRGLDISVLELQPGEARDLIRKPMKDYFGSEQEQYDPYDSYSGEAAITRLMDLSGNNPYYLTGLCKRLFENFRNGECGEFISEYDVEQLVDDYKAHSYKLNDTFDSLLSENADGTSDKKVFIKILKLIADKADSNGVCRSRDIICEGLDKKQSDAKAEKLRARNILEHRPAGYRIKVQLLASVMRSMSDEQIEKILDAIGEE